MSKDKTHVNYIRAMADMIYREILPNELDDCLSVIIMIAADISDDMKCTVESIDGFWEITRAALMAGAVRRAAKEAKEKSEEITH